MYNVIDIAKKLISCPSVTPEDAGAQDYLAEILTEMGFECHRLPFGDGSDHVPNLFARIGTQGPHICYAGHTDVVPTGPLDKWTSPPFEPTIRDGKLYGRGASDMKGSVAAFIAATSAYLEDNGTPKGSISLLITGDEEGPAINGTVKVLEWMEKHGHIPDVAIVGEPTNPSELGQEVKIGRRGSYNGTLRVNGKQGHVAYQHIADNPLPRLIQMLDMLARYEFDQGNEFFPPTNLEITTIDVGNEATNVIPNSGTAVFNIRFNNLWTSQSLHQKITDILTSTDMEYELDWHSGAESFMTEPGDWSDIVIKAVNDVTGKIPEITTSGGTSDARFVSQICPTIEFGPINDTIHQIDENAGLDVLEGTTKIYQKILELYFTT